MQLATALQVERLALPVLLSGRAGLSKADVIIQMLRSLACFLVTESHTLREVMVAIYKGGTSDHAEVERKRLGELTLVRDQIARWSAETTAINTRLTLLQQLLASAGEDRDLQELLGPRVALDRRALCRFFECPAAADATSAAVGERQDNAPRNQQEYDFALRQLTALYGSATAFHRRHGRLPGAGIAARPMPAPAPPAPVGKVGRPWTGRPRGPLAAAPCGPPPRKRVLLGRLTSR